MIRWHWAKSLATRVAAGFCIGGLLLSIALGAVTYRYAVHRHSAAAGQNLSLTAYHLRDAVKPMLEAGDDQAIANIMNIFARDPRIEGVRLADGAGGEYRSRSWPENLHAAQTWTLNEHATSNHQPLDLDRRTVIVVPLGAGGEAGLRLVIDGPYMRAQIRREALGNMATTWIMLGLLTLAGLVFMRRWLTGPLVRLAHLASRDAPAADFEQAASDCGGELRQLAESLARMLHRIDDMTRQLRQRERAYAHLYEFAPAAMLSVGPDGRILDANQRAADLFGMSRSDELIGHAIIDHIHPRDRALFRQSIDRLLFEQVSHCELTVTVGGASHDIAVQFAAVADSAGSLEQVRLSLIDISQTRRLVRQVTEQRQLMDLVINHMSDGIVIVSPDRRIVTANAQLCRTLNVHREALTEHPFEPGELFACLEAVDVEAFEKRLRLAVDHPERSSREQFDCRGGSYAFSAVPVQDAAGQLLAQLWVIEDVTAETRNRRLMRQQDAQLRALQRMGAALHEVVGVDHLLERACRELTEVMDVEALGLAIRHHDPQQRCRQIIHTAAGQTHLATGESVAAAVRTGLLPNVLPQRSTSFWPDLAGAGEWSAPFRAAGFETMAAAALCTSDRAQGLIWIARKGGKSIERYHIYLLEALAPMMSTALENAELRDRMRDLALADPVTGLPSVAQFPILSRQISGADSRWSLLMLDIDRFSDLNGAVGHAGADQALRQVAEVLLDCCRRTDQPLRYSEDKFLVLCPKADPDAAHHLAERIRTRIEQTTVDLDAPDAQPPALTCSLGLASAPTDGDDPAVLLDVVLGRVRVAKANGRNRVAAAGPAPPSQAG